MTSIAMTKRASLGFAIPALIWVILQNHEFYAIPAFNETFSDKDETYFSVNWNFVFNKS